MKRGPMKRARVPEQWFWTVALLLIAPAALAAQELPLKPLVSPAATAEIFTCPAFEEPVGGAAVSQVVVDSLITSGIQAGLRGDYVGARLLLRQASFLDPTNPAIPYRLATTFDELGSVEEARIEYCRYLSLSPRATNAPDVMARIQALSGGGEDPSEQPGRSAFKEGVEAFEGRRYGEAVNAFTRAINAHPENAEAYYNRAISQIAAGSPTEARADLERYLDLSPEAEDYAAVEARLASLGPPSILGGSPAQPVFAESPARDFRDLPSPGGALLRGLVVPGFGQFSTGRPALGTLVLAAAGGAVYWGIREEIAVERRSATDPFGNVYEFDVRVIERPNQMIGFGAAAGIAALGALESYFHARGERAAFGGMAAADSGRPRLEVTTTRRSLGFAVTVPFPAVDR